jgi:hypothetical protein
MKSRMLMVVVLVLLLVAGGVQTAVADQSRGAIQVRGVMTEVEEGLNPYPDLDNPLPGGRFRMINPDGAWGNMEFTSTHIEAAQSISGWYEMYNIDGILQPGGVIQWTASWQLWLSDPWLDDYGAVRRPADEHKGPWSGTLRSALQVGEPDWGNAQFVYQGAGSGEWEGWGFTVNATVKEGDILAMRISGHLTPPTPRGR